MGVKILLKAIMIVLITIIIGVCIGTYLMLWRLGYGL